MLYELVSSFVICHRAEVALLDLLSRKNAAERVESSRKNIGVATKLENLMFAPQYVAALLTIQGQNRLLSLQNVSSNDLDLIFEMPLCFCEHDDKS